MQFLHQVYRLLLLCLPSSIPCMLLLSFPHIIDLFLLLSVGLSSPRHAHTSTWVHESHASRPSNYFRVTSSAVSIHGSKHICEYASHVWLTTLLSVVSSSHPSKENVFYVNSSSWSRHIWEEHSEDIIRVKIVSEERSLRLKSLPVFLFRSKLIVVLPFLRVAQTSKCLTEFLESICRFRCSILIRMQLQC